MAATHPEEPGPLEMPTTMQSDSRSGPNRAMGWLKTRARDANTPQCAFKSASPVGKLALGAHLAPKPGMAASHLVDPTPLEMPTIFQSDPRSGLTKPLGCLKTRA